MSTPNNVSSGFKVPFNIPGAPERVTFSQLVDEAKPLIQNSLDSFQRKPGAFETTLSQATWWHFWLLVGISAVVSAVSAAVTLAIVDSQIARIIPGYSRGVFSLLIYMIVAIFVSVAAFYAGVYASHWWATKQAGGSASLVQHSYALGVIWAGNIIITSVISLVLGVIGLGGIGSLITLVVAIFSLYLMGGNIQRLYQFPNSNQVWLTGIVMVLTSFVASLVLLSILQTILR